MPEKTLQELREAARALWNEIERLPASQQATPIYILAHNLCVAVAEVTAPGQGRQ